MANTLTLSGDVSFIEWLDVFGAPESEMPTNAPPREVEH